MKLSDKVITMIDEDIIKAESVLYELESENINKIHQNTENQCNKNLFRIHKELDGKYQSYFEDWGKGMYQHSKNGFNYYHLEGVPYALSQNIEIMLSRLKILRAQEHSFNKIKTDIEINNDLSNAIDINHRTGRNPSVKKIVIVLGVISSIITILGLGSITDVWECMGNRGAMTPAQHDEYYNFAMTVPSTTDIPSETIELDDYTDSVESFPMAMPIIVAEDIIITEGTTYRNYESWLIISPTRISGALNNVVLNITTHEQSTHSRTLGSGEVWLYTFGERAFSLTIDEINWSANRNNSHIVISIHEYVVE